MLPSERSLLKCPLMFILVELSEEIAVWVVGVGALPVAA